MSKPKKASNGVLMESLDCEQVKHKISVQPLELKRTANGYWSLTYTIDLKFALPDGRTLATQRQQHIGVIGQTGRRKRTVKATQPNT